MADNLTAQSSAPATPTAGTVYRTLADASNDQWVPGVIAFTTNSSSPWTFQLVNSSNGLPVAMVGSVTVTQSGAWTVTANAGTNLNTSALALETGGNLATLAGAVSAAVVQTNVKQVNGVAPSMGNGISGTGVQRVTIASDSTGQVALAAGANLVGQFEISDGTNILLTSSHPGFVQGTVAATQSGNWSTRTQDGSGNSLTSATRGAQQALSVQVVDASGNQVTSFGGSGGTASNFTSAFPSSGTAAGYSDGTNMQGAKVFDLDTGVGLDYNLGFSWRLSNSGGSVEGGTASHPIRTDPTGSTTQPVSAASLPLPTNAAQETGGNLATLAGTVTSSVLQSNTKQINGVAPSMGNGVSGTGVQRVTIASDSTGQVALASGSNTIGALTANQTVNLAQVAGSSTATGHGTAAGAIRVELPTDGTGVVNAAQSGTWNIGTVTTVTTVSAVTAISNALPAGTNTLGKVDFAPIAAQLTSAKIDTTSTGDNTLVAQVGGQTTKMYRLFLTVSAATNLQFKDGATALTGAMTLQAGGSLTFDFDGEPWFTGSTNTNFILNQSGTAQISGRIYYIQS